MKQKIFAAIFTLILAAGLMPLTGAINLPEGVPSSLEAATIEKIEVKTDEDGVPYFNLELKIPQRFLELSEQCPADGYTWIDYFWKIDDGSWENLSGGTTISLFDESYGNEVPGKANTFRVSYLYPENEGNAEEIIINDHLYTIKVQLAYAYRYDAESLISFVYSPLSNEVSIGSGSFYSKAADWAKPELQKAYDLGLIPDILKGADMTRPITREEFCELALLLYEKATGSKSEPASPNPFNDTTNLQILKAYKLGITYGMSASTFSPNLLINREQCAAMLFRAIKAIKPDGDFSIAGVKDFPDQEYISSWAVEATKFMSKIGIITGDDRGYFMPKATTTAQEAAGYGMATREQAIAMTARTFDRMSDIS